MQAPLAGRLTLSGNIAAACPHPQRAAHVLQFYAPRPRFDFAVAWPGLFHLYAATARGGHKAATDAAGADRAATRGGVRGAFHRIHFQVARTGFRPDVVPDVFNLHAARARAGLHRPLDALHRLAARARLRAQARPRGHHEVVADGDVVGQLAVLHAADANEVAMLLDGGIRFEVTDFSFRLALVQVPALTGFDRSVDMDVGGGSGTHVDVAGARRHFELHRTGYCQSPFKGPLCSVGGHTDGAPEQDSKDCDWPTRVWSCFFHRRFLKQFVSFSVTQYVSKSVRQFSVIYA